jgi:predicted AlkP superfamily pyrophosphatase or phosphodiesterase
LLKVYCMLRTVLLSFCCLLIICIGANAQVKPAAQPAKPKLVVGFVVDQMRWDYLYRYADRYGKDGFKRLLREGFSCENTMIPYAPTVTACGHACIYTGSVPAINGITGNNWWDNELNRDMYCSEDKAVKTTGSGTKAGEMSPKNMLVTTIGDELRLASNFKSKVIGIAIKDRGAILPAGHSANAAYWYDGDNGNWITSTHYMEQLPGWVNNFNSRKLPDSLMALNWNTLYPVSTYSQSNGDEHAYEGKYTGETSSSFPHNFSSLGSKKYGVIRATPQGNTLTLEFAKAAVDNEKLGMGNATDFLTVSCSSPDYIGHQFGPNSIENEDDYLRLDAELATFLKYLDAKIGKGNYLFFLSADHGVAHIPGFLKENNLPGKPFDDTKVIGELNKKVKEKFGIEKLIVSGHNYQLSFNRVKLDSAGLQRETVIDFLLPLIKKTEGVANAFDITRLSETTLPDVQKKMLSNGYYHNRCGEIQIILLPGWIDGSAIGTTHGLWNPYDAHIPLVWFGWNVKQGKLNKETYMTDIAPTIAAMLQVQMPSGNVGHVITEVMK